MCTVNCCFEPARGSGVWVTILSSYVLPNEKHCDSKRMTNLSSDVLLNKKLCGGQWITILSFMCHLTKNYAMLTPMSFCFFQVVPIHDHGSLFLSCTFHILDRALLPSILGHSPSVWMPHVFGYITPSLTTHESQVLGSQQEHFQQLWTTLLILLVSLYQSQIRRTKGS